MNNPGFKKGLYYGATAIALYLIAYVINKRIIYSPGFGPVISFIIPIVFMVLAARSTRQSQEGFMAFGEALSPTFLTYVIGSLIFVLFSFVMTSMVDPSLNDIAKEVALETMDKLSGLMSEDQIDIMKDAVEESTNASIGKTLIGWAFSLIFPGFIMAAIISAIMKKNAVA